MPIEEFFQEFEAWVVDPRNIDGMATDYDKMLMLYWVNKNLLAQSSLSNATKREGDEEHVRVWKEHNVDCLLMHRKIDIIARKIGIQFMPKALVEEGKSLVSLQVRSEGPSERHHVP